MRNSIHWLWYYDNFSESPGEKNISPKRLKRVLDDNNDDDDEALTQALATSSKTHLLPRSPRLL
jgi:hypothetical protein